MNFDADDNEAALPTVVPQEATPLYDIWMLLVGQSPHEGTLSDLLGTPHREVAEHLAAAYTARAQRLGRTQEHYVARARGDGSPPNAQREEEEEMPYDDEEEPFAPSSLYSSQATLSQAIAHAFSHEEEQETPAGNAPLSTPGSVEVEEEQEQEEEPDLLWQETWPYRQDHPPTFPAPPPEEGWPFA